ncbi:hypothetical protein Q7C_2114 [Methylophaga frappieri]|uniref:Uncharacterized protein n=1 Tax=Methylophaga frappieri (strain ATCC BAA-2434 / DSM 25690 / JAM7) TaxID=754477 RepID=I1YK07_METFJ|nr:hypothetical protein [Methylophaga frappieri]AFJ03250.1 hypothetical protein Q7C_2114 [Methylophaga frappieri]
MAWQFLNKARYLIGVVVCSTSVTMLSACSDEPEISAIEGEDYAAVKPIPQYLQQGMPDYVPPEMLSVGDLTAPEDWLLSLYLEQNPDANRQASFYTSRFEKITPYVHDTPRVIANRTVQISNQLNEQGIEADVDELLTDFANHIDSTSHQYVYGDLCAQYVTLRRQNLSHADAIVHLFDNKPATTP